MAEGVLQLGTGARQANQALGLQLSQPGVDGPRRLVLEVLQLRHERCGEATSDHRGDPGGVAGGVG
ncbi:MAG: hypothetical protein ACLFWM_00295 [Actinomycetota bacterium]